MRAWVESLVGPEYADIAVWAGAAAIVALLLLIFYRIARSYSRGTFVMGGRNRRTRLAVMDAAAIDGQRRLVLVRRDDVEHLILIGGPTDVVVEQNIRLAGRPGRGAGEVDAPAESSAPPPERRAASERPAPSPMPAAPVAPAPVPRVQVQPLPRREAVIQPLHRPQPLDAAAAAPQAEVARPIASTLRRPEPPMAPPMKRPARSVEHETTVPAVAMPVAPVRAQQNAAPAAPAPATPAPAARTDGEAEAGGDDRQIDDALLQELEATLDDASRGSGARNRSLDEEMAKLLGDLSGERR